MIERLAIWTAFGLAVFGLACVAVNSAASAVLEVLPR